MTKGEAFTISDFMPPEEKCHEHLRQTRWHDGVVCPKCGSYDVKMNGTENGKQRYYCFGHKGSFSDTTGTIFYYSKIPLRFWYYFIFFYMQNQSAYHLSEVLGMSYKTALRRVRLIKSCTKGSCDEIKLGDIIEFDELYLSVGEKGNIRLGVSKKYLPEYTSFFEFVENNKKDGWLTLLDKVIVLA